MLLFPAPAPTTCTVGTVARVPVKLNADDQNWLNKIGGLLNASILAAVDYERDHGLSNIIRYVDPTAAFDGHAICSAQPWIVGLAGLAKGPSGLPTVNSASFHPNPAGVRAFARLINGCLDGSVSC